MCKFDIAFASYVFMAILIFGFSANYDQRGCINDPEYDNHKNEMSCEVVYVGRGLIKGTIWPLYISYQAFSFVR